MPTTIGLLVERVAGGFAKAATERCTLLSNKVLAPADVSRQEGERRLSVAEAALARVDGSDVVAEELALERVQSARVLIEVVITPELRHYSPTARVVLPSQNNEMVEY